MDIKRSLGTRPGEIKKVHMTQRFTEIEHCDSTPYQQVTDIEVIAIVLGSKIGAMSVYDSKGKREIDYGCYICPNNQYSG